MDNDIAELPDVPDLVTKLGRPDAAAHDAEVARLCTEIRMLRRTIWLLVSGAGGSMTITPAAMREYGGANPWLERVDDEDGAMRITAGQFPPPNA